MRRHPMEVRPRSLILREPLMGKPVQAVSNPEPNRLQARLDLARLRALQCNQHI